MITCEPTNLNVFADKREAIGRLMDAAAAIDAELNAAQ